MIARIIRRYTCVLFFFFSSRRRHTRCGRDWSSDVCSSDLLELGLDLLEDREVLLSLEGLRAHVGLVLVDGRELGEVLGLRLVGEMLVGERGPDALEPGPLLLQPLPRLLGVHWPEPTGTTLRPYPRSE